MASMRPLAILESNHRRIPSRCRLTVRATVWKTCRPKIYSYGIGKKLNEGHTHLPPHWELACCPTIARAYRAKCTVRYLAVEVDDELQNTRSVHG
jgi:hypothetical protein